MKNTFQCKIILLVLISFLCGHACIAQNPDSLMKMPSLCGQIKYSTGDLNRIIFHLDRKSLPIDIYHWNIEEANCDLILASKYLMRKRLYGTAGTIWLVFPLLPCFVSTIVATAQGEDNTAIAALSISTAVLSVPTCIFYISSHRNGKLSRQKITHAKKILSW